MWYGVETAFIDGELLVPVVCLRRGVKVPLVIVTHLNTSNQGILSKNNLTTE